MWNACRGGVIAVCCAVLVGCGSPDPQTYLVGKWAADNSATAVAGRVFQMNQQAPDMSVSYKMNAARALGAVAIEMRADGTASAVMVTHTFEGTWKFDPAASLVEYDLKNTNPPDPDAEAPPAEQGVEAEEPENREWIGELDMESKTLTVLPIPRSSYNFYKSIQKGPGGAQAFQGFKLKKGSE